MSRSNDRMSSFRTSRFFPGNWPGNLAARSLSNSIAITLSACLNSSEVSVPSPGPISRIVSVLRISAAPAISLSMNLSVSQCWPSSFFTGTSTIHGYDDDLRLLPSYHTYPGHTYSSTLSDKHHRPFRIQSYYTVMLGLHHTRHSIY